MERMRNSGMTLQQIGDKFNVCRERVRQIIGNTGTSFLRKRGDEILRKMPESEIHNLSRQDWIKCGGMKEAWWKVGAKIHHKLNGKSLSLGQNGERYVSKTLAGLGIKNNLAGFRSHFDIALDCGKTIDVKTCNSPKIRRKSVSKQWSFNVKKKSGKYADFFALVIWPTKEIFIIPSNLALKYIHIQFCWPTTKPTMAKWAKYLGAFNQLTCSNS